MENLMTNKNERGILTNALYRLEHAPDCDLTRWAQQMLSPFQVADNTFMPLLKDADAYKLLSTLRLRIAPTSQDDGLAVWNVSRGFYMIEDVDLKRAVTKIAALMRLNRLEHYNTADEDFSHGD